MGSRDACEGLPCRMALWAYHGVGFGWDVIKTAQVSWAGRQRHHTGDLPGTHRETCPPARQATHPTLTGHPPDLPGWPRGHKVLGIGYNAK